MVLFADLSFLAAGHELGLPSSPAAKSCENPFNQLGVSSAPIIVIVATWLSFVALPSSPAVFKLGLSFVALKLTILIQQHCTSWDQARPCYF